MKLMAGAVLLLLAVVPAVAQVHDTFTLNSTPALTVIFEHSYYTYAFVTFDDQPASGDAVHHLDTGFWDFSFPGVALDGCTLASSTISPLTRGGPLYQTQTTVDNFSCNAHSVQTVGVRNYKLVSCGRGGNTCFAEILPRPPLTGTVTP
jgi:hypothetical protein